MRYRKFIPVEERLPEIDQLVDIYLKKPVCPNVHIVRNQVFYKRYDGEFIFNDISWWITDAITTPSSNSIDESNKTGYTLRSKLVTHWLTK